MALVTRLITNLGDALTFPNGTPIAGVRVRFTLINSTTSLPTDGWDTFTKERVAGQVEVTTGPTGEFPNVPLCPNDRLTGTTQYLCQVFMNGVTSFKASLPTGDLSNIAWIDFMAQGVPLTPAELSTLQTHINNTGMHVYPAGQGNKLLRINTAGTAVEYVNEEPVHISTLGGTIDLSNTWFSSIIVSSPSALTQDVTIIVPTKKGLFPVENITTGTFVVKCATATQVAPAPQISQSSHIPLYCGGVDCEFGTNNINNSLPAQALAGGLYLKSTGAQVEWSGTVQIKPANIVGNTATVVLDDAATYIIDTTGLLTAPGNITISLLNNVPFVIYFDNLTTGGQPLTFNSIYTIPADISLWYYDGVSLYEEVFNVNKYVPTTRAINGKQLSNNVTLVPADIGLGNVDNTSDATKNAANATLTNKTISTAQNTLIVGQDLSLSNFKIRSMADPLLDTDGVNKRTMDNALLGFLNKINAITSSTTALPAYTYAPGALGVGATITANAPGILTLDTYSPALLEYVLIKDELGGNAPYNGVYEVTTVGTALVPFVLTRVQPLDLSTEFAGSAVFIQGGLANKSTTWTCITSNPTVGTTPIVFVQTNASLTYTAGVGISLIGTQITADTTVVPFKTDPLSVFASTTSAQLAGVISDEVGTGNLVFNTAAPMHSISLYDKHTIATGGTYLQQGLDLSPLYHFSWTLLTSGDLYTLVGDFVMEGWSHNTTIDANGNFIGRLDPGACEMHVITESGTELWYTAPADILGSPPVWVLKSSYNSSTGNKTYLGSLTANNLSGTNTGNESQASIGTLIGASTIKSVLVDADSFPIRDSVGGLLNRITWLDFKTNIPSNAIPSTNDFRLSLTSGVPVTAADVYGASTIYMVPYLGNKISLFTGTAWATRTSAQFSLGLSGLTGGLPYDIFVYDNAGVPTMEFAAWTNTSTRATPLASQDGVLVKSGDTTRRYVGSFTPGGATTVSDAAAARNLWNYNNRVLRSLASTGTTTTSYTYTSGIWRLAENNAANTVGFIVGVAEDTVEAVSNAIITGSGAYQKYISIGYDVTNAINANATIGGMGISGSYMSAASSLFLIPAAGVHTLSRIEYGGTGTTFYPYSAGVYQSRLIGTLKG